ncbi:MAG: hypothetical protein GX975_02360 [Clostridiales bacterium]|nr:hypothetical protein [Clostridiales bacterium]
MKNKKAVIAVALLVICVVIVAIIFYIPRKAETVLKFDLASVKSAEITYHPLGTDSPSQIVLSESDTEELIETIGETNFVFRSPSKQSIWHCPSYKVVLYTQDALKSSNRGDSISFTIAEDGAFSLDKGIYKAGSDAIYELLESLSIL